MTSGSTNIKLDQFLKLAGISQTGGQAKLLIQGGKVKVNDTVETRRARKLQVGDLITVGKEIFTVEVKNM